MTDPEKPKASSEEDVLTLPTASPLVFIRAGDAENHCSSFT
jgi:hypothetical protein